MNLLTPDKWKYAFPWGNIINPGTAKEIVINRYLVNWLGSRVAFNVQHSPLAGWYMDKDWIQRFTVAKTQIGHMVSRDLLYYGEYYFRFFLPRSQGAWPAIWFVDTSGVLGMPPEVDVFEHFRKDGFLTRFALTATYHYGKTYEQDKVISKKLRRCMGFLPVDLSDIYMKFTWLPDRLTWEFDGKEVLTVRRSQVDRYPDKPMNLIMGNGIGLDWNPGAIEPFQVFRAEYNAKT